MNRGPMPNTRPAGPSFVDKVATAYPAGVPDWLMELAHLADKDGLAGAEKRIGYSRSAISTALNGKYAGDLDRMAQMVRGALLAETVMCPVLGELTRNICLDWQKKPYAPTSSHRVQMYVTCQTCPNNAAKAKREDAA